MCEISPELHAQLKDNTLQILGCGCAAREVTLEGSIIYDYFALVEHFVVHSFGKELGDEDAFYEAEDHVTFNVLRGLDYAQQCGDKDIILPCIQFEDGERVWPEEQEDSNK